jgi:uncharacterized protein YbjT (DUF2867 family)
MMDSAKVLVTGGTGTLGRLVVARLQADGRVVRVLSRHARPNANGIEFRAGDLGTGEGVDAAVAGTDVIVHCAGGPNGDEVKALHLVEAASRAGVQHLVYISVVGADRVPVTSAVDRAMFTYFKSKRRAELVIAHSDVPWTTLRATQFHELVLIVAQALTRLPVVPVFAGFRFQPVAAAEVAEQLVELASASPAGLVADIAGPRIYAMADLVRGFMGSRGMRKPILPIWIPGKAAAAIRNGATLAPDRAVGRCSFEEWLAAPNLSQVALAH